MFARLLWCSCRARRSRLLLALMAVTLGVAVAIALARVALEVGDDFARTLRAAGPNFVLLPKGAQWPADVGGADYVPVRAGADLDIGILPELKRSFWKNNILAVSPELSIPAVVDGNPTLLVGTWFEHELATEEGIWRTGLASLRPHWTLAGRWPAEDAAELVVSEEWAQQHGAQIGRRLAVSLGGQPASWIVTGILSTGSGNASVWAPLAKLQDLSGRGEGIDRIWMSALVREPPPGPAPDPTRDPEAYERFMCTAFPANVAREISGRVPAADVLPMSEVLASEAGVVAKLNRLMLMLAGLGLMASILGLLSTNTATVIERSLELGLLRALGATERQLAALLLGETMLVSLVGGLLGWSLGMWAAGMIRGDTTGVVTISPLLLPLALLLAVVLALLGTSTPLRLALRLDPATVLRG